MINGPRKRYYRLLLWAFKLTVTGLICSWLIQNIEWQDFLNAIRSLSPSSLLVLFALAIAGLMVSTWKWQILLRIHGVHYPYFQLAKWYYTGAFISIFLPTNIGGDAYRIFRTYRNPRGRITSVLSVIVERITGLLALLFMGYLAALVSWYESGNQLSYYVAITGTLGILVGIAALMIALKFNFTNKLLKWKNSPKYLSSLIAHAGDYLAQSRNSTYVIVLSFLFHIIRITSLLFLLHHFEADVSTFDVFIVASLTTLLGMLPISIGGFGVIEGSFTYLMSFYGLPLNIGLSSILIFRIIGILITLLGAVFYLWEKESPVKKMPDLSE